MHKGLLFGERVGGAFSETRFRQEILETEDLLKVIESGQGSISSRQKKVLFEVGTAQIQKFYEKESAVSLFLQKTHYPRSASFAELADLQVLASITLKTSWTQEHLSRRDLDTPTVYQCGIGVVSAQGIAGYLPGEFVCYMTLRDRPHLRIWESDFEDAIKTTQRQANHMKRSNIYGFLPEECELEAVEQFVRTQTADKIRKHLKGLQI